MMDVFRFYILQGIFHILDLDGLDHLLFVVTLCAIYRFEDWRKILMLITAFTIGHSVTLVLSTLELVRVNQDLVEVLIPVTILLTCVANVWQKKPSDNRGAWNYLLAMSFGLIHGLGFSTFFRSMMMGISDEGILQPLLSFNLGVEIGQCIIVVCLMLVLFVFTRVLLVNHRLWKWSISGVGGCCAAYMIIERLW